MAQRLTCDLAESLTGDPAAADRLAELERNGVVVAEADDTTWYRYHPLFGTLLGARLRHCHRDLADELHRRAGGWFLAHGMSREAEAQARVARDWAEVGRLAGRRWVDDAAAGADAVADQVATVPPPALMANAGLALLAAVAACRRADRGAADAYRAVVDDLTGDGSGPDAGPPPEARALLDIDYARAFGSDDRGRRAVAALSGSPGDVGAAERRPAGLAQVGALGAVALDLDDGLTESARKAAATLAFPAGASRLAGEAEALLAVATAVEGQLAAAVDHAESVLAAGPSGRPVARHAASLALAVAHASAGEPRLALDALAGVEVVDGADGWLRRLDAALRMALRTAGTAVVERCPDGTPHPLVDRALVAVGVLEAVDPGGRVIPLGGPLERRVLRARHAWHERDAREVLEAAAADPDTGGHPRTGIERAALVALAADQHGDHERTVRELRAALSAGDATRIRAPLRLLAADLAAPLTTHHEALAPHQALALDLVDRARVSPAPPFVEPLTEHEVMVLRHLPSLMSNQEIADGMHVSVNTVKTHLKALYRKLGVTSRREAVQQGRALELL